MSKFKTIIVISFILLLSGCSIGINKGGIKTTVDDTATSSEEMLGGGIFRPKQGGTGTSTIPTYGQMLLGQTDGSYDLVATSTLGISAGGGSGTVTSVDMSVPTGLTISGNPITTSGTLALDLDTGYQMLTDVASSTWDNKWTLADGVFDVYGQATSTKDWLLTQNNVWTGAGNTSFAGNVGIGTDSPATPLEISAGSLANNIEFNVNGSTDTTNKALSIRTFANGYTKMNIVKNLEINYDARNSNNNSHNLRFSSGGTPVMDLKNSGNVGIGTTTPAYPLDVDGDFRVGEEGSANALFVDATNGRVNIGNNNSTYNLDVTGTGRFTGALKVGAYTLPATDGTADYILKTDGSGTLSWVANGAGTSFASIADINSALSGESVASTTNIWDFSDYTNATAGTGITFTDDAISTNDSEIVLSSLSGYDANGVIDWTTDQGVTNINAGNYTDTTYTSSDFTHNSLTGVSANEHLDWTADLGAVNINAGNYTDTNTTYTAGGTLLDLTGTTFSINEGTLTDTKYCTYEVASGIVCNSEGGGFSSIAGINALLSGETVASTTASNANFVNDAGYTTNGSKWTNWGANTIITPNTSSIKVAIGYADPTTAPSLFSVNGNTSLVGTLDINGSLGSTGSRVTKGWFTDVESTNMYTVGGTSLSSTFSPIAGSASILTVGALDTGSITANFGSINNGTSGIVSTGLVDIGGGSLEIPQDGTVDATGEIQLNTASSTLEVYDGSKVAVIPSEQTVGFTIASTTFRNFLKIPIKAHKEAITITDIQCFVDTATDQDIFISDGTNDTETIACTVAGAEDDGTITNGTFNAREQMYVEMGTAAGDPSWLNVNITYTINP